MNTSAPLSRGGHIMYFNSEHIINSLTFPVGWRGAGGEADEFLPNPLDFLVQHPYNCVFMHNRIRTLLRQADLREEEIELYILLLTLHSATLAELQQKSSLHASCVYRTMKRLVERALVEAIPVNQKQSIYKPLSLHALLKKLRTEQKRLRHLELSLEGVDALLPYMDVSDPEKCDDESMIDIVSGADAFCQAYIEIPEQADEEFCALGCSDSFWNASGASIDSSLERSFVSRRLKNNVYSRVLMLATDDAEKIAQNDSKEKRTSKLKSSLPVMNDMLMMHSNTVSYFSCDPDNPRVIHIRNPEFVELQRSHFEMLWKS